MPAGYPVNIWVITYRRKRNTSLRRLWSNQPEEAVVAAWMGVHFGNDDLEKLHVLVRLLDHLPLKEVVVPGLALVEDSLQRRGHARLDAVDFAPPVAHRTLVTALRRRKAPLVLLWRHVTVAEAARYKVVCVKVIGFASARESGCSCGFAPDVCAVWSLKQTAATWSFKKVQQESVWIYLRKNLEIFLTFS